MKRSKLLPIATGVLTSALVVAGATTPGYAWSWGSEDQENYRFNPEHRAEILEYGTQIGANWSGEIKEAASASQDEMTVQLNGGDTVDPSNARGGAPPQAED